MLGLGRVSNYVAVASGVPISLKNASAVTFYGYEDDGSQIMTLTQSSSAAAADEATLACITVVHKGPGVGGTWTKVTQAAAATYDNADDGTNDCVSLTVHASQLTPGLDYVECTVDGGTLAAEIHDLNVQCAPANLTSTLA